MKPQRTKYTMLLDNIGYTIEAARQNSVKAINTELVKSNWEIGRHIVEFEQRGQERAEYGSDLLARLSKDLTLRKRIWPAECAGYAQILPYLSEMAGSACQIELDTFCVIAWRFKHCGT